MAKDTRDRLLETTVRLLQNRGYHGTSLNDILETSGAPRGSLYFHFPGGKDQLAVEATRAAVDAATEWLRETMASAKDPAQGVRAYAEGIAAALRDSDYTFGCPVAPLVLDSTLVEELRDLCREGFETWVGLLETSFRDAGVSEQRSHGLALLVESCIEGLMLIARAYKDTRPLIEAASELEAAVRAVMPSPRRKRPNGPYSGASSA